MNFHQSLGHKGFAALAVLATIGAAGCSGADSGEKSASGEKEPAIASTSQALTTTGYGDCTVYASISQPSKNGFGEVSCGNYHNFLQVEVCLMQLMPGGWQTIGWTCQVWGTNQQGNLHHYAWTNSGAVPYWTSGRYYATQVWAWVDSGNPVVYMTSESMKG